MSAINYFKIWTKLKSTKIIDTLPSTKLLTPLLLNFLKSYLLLISSSIVNPRLINGELLWILLSHLCSPISVISLLKHLTLLITTSYLLTCLSLNLLLIFLLLLNGVGLDLTKFNFQNHSSLLVFPLLLIMTSILLWMILIRQSHPYWIVLFLLRRLGIDFSLKKLLGLTLIVLSRSNRYEKPSELIVITSP